MALLQTCRIVMAWIQKTQKLIGAPKWTAKGGFLTQYKGVFSQKKTQFLAGDDEISWAVWWRMDRIFVEVELD